MVVINCAYTEAINPAGATPVLTREQIWKGLQRKIRAAHEFVPVIKGTDVVEDKGDEVTRVAHFANGKDVREVCKSYYPTKVDFWQPDGALITNTVSDGPEMTEEDCWMTYTFERRLPNVESGSDEHKKALKELRDLAKVGVHDSILSIRRMAAAGQLD